MGKNVTIPSNSFIDVGFNNSNYHLHAKKCHQDIRNKNVNFSTPVELCHQRIYNKI